MPAENLGVRVIRLRTGVVLGRTAPAFIQLKRVISLGIGGKLGSGRQWMPWIHETDYLDVLRHLATNSKITGACNACAPNSATNAEFTRCLANTLHRPAILPVPSFALRLVLGGFSEALLGSQRVIPAVLDSTGFTFQFGTLESALHDLCR